MENNSLSHWGIKGMKWGVRRYQNKDGSLTALGRKRQKNDDADSQSNTKPAAKKKISDMTDDEIRTKINRMQLEEQYKNLLSPKQEPKVSKGKKIVMDILESSATNIGKQTVTYLMGAGVNKMFANMFNDPSIVNPKKGQKDK